MRNLLAFALVLSSLFARTSSADDDTSTAQTTWYAQRLVRIVHDGEFCSGAFIHDSGVVLTAAHCVVDAELRNGDHYGTVAPQVTLAMADRGDRAVADRYHAEVLRADLQLDLALVRVTSRVNGDPLPARFPTFALASEAPVPLEDVITLGYPNASPWLATETGKVSAIEKNGLGEASYLRTTAHTNGGDSGGPTVDGNGHILGVHVQTAGRNANNAIDRSIRRIPAEWLVAMTDASALPVLPVVPTLSATASTARIDYRGDEYHFASYGVYGFHVEDPDGTGTVSATCDDGLTPQIAHVAGLLVVVFQEPIGEAPRVRACEVTFHKGEKTDAPDEQL